MSTRLDPVRIARAYLCAAVEPPSPALAALVADVGPVAAAAQVAGRTAPPEVLADTRAAAQGYDGEADLAAGHRLGLRLVTPEDTEEWPTAALHCLTTPVPQLEDEPAHRWAAPVALWVRGGRLDELTARAVAIVGARAATGYGEHLASDWSYGLAEHGVTIVSGTGLGIEGAALRAALSADGATALAVQPSGLGRAFPGAHTRLLDHVAQRGAVVSEYPPGALTTRSRFVASHRVIAALAAGTVLVEAGRRSGSLHTAQTARALGRAVMAAPGPVTSALSLGCHDLVRQGHATLVTTAADILADAALAGER